MSQKIRTKPALGNQVVLFQNWFIHQHGCQEFGPEAANSRAPQGHQLVLELSSRLFDKRVGQHRPGRRPVNGLPYQKLGRGYCSHNYGTTFRKLWRHRPAAGCADRSAVRRAPEAARASRGRPAAWCAPPFGASDSPPPTTGDSARC